ncbi:MAG: nuclear transport factor 2 family protein [Bacillota bacterium]
MKKKLIILLPLLVIASLLIFVQANKPSDADTNSIVNVIRKAASIADNNRSNANNHRNNGTLEANKASMKAQAKTDLRDVFTEDLASRLENVWVDRQFNDTEGPNQIQNGVTNVEIKEITVSDNTAQVTAVVSKYLVDRVTKDGRNYLDRMDGTVVDRVTLIKENGKWKISGLDSTPSLDAKHTVTPE